MGLIENPYRNYDYLIRKRWYISSNGACTEQQDEADSMFGVILTKWDFIAIVWINAASHSIGKQMKPRYERRALKCHALSVTVTHFGLLSRSPATHCISHALYFSLKKNNRLYVI